MVFRGFIFVLLFQLTASENLLEAQHNAFVISKTPEICQKGSASLILQENYDSLQISWSTGAVNVTAIHGLESGQYTVRIRTVKDLDTSTVRKDTTIVFDIDKEQCPVHIAKYFSPNDDGYNDLLTIGNIEAYPDFELIIFNKWGQRVHQQKESYIPWDGRWLGTNLPDGTYYFILFFDPNKQNEFVKGDITILR